MAIGERIRFFRNLRGMTQKYLGVMAGFPESTADIRMAQYESGTRTPKDELVKTLSSVLGVSPSALSVPDIDSEIGLMHTLFALEDLCGLQIESKDGKQTLSFSRSDLASALCSWSEQAEKYRSGEITKEEYDRWRYNFPKFDTSERWAKISSADLSDALTDAFKKHIQDK